MPESYDRQVADAPASRPNAGTNADAADMNIRATGAGRGFVPLSAYIRMQSGSPYQFSRQDLTG